MKSIVDKYLPYATFVAGIIGTGVGVFVSFYFKMPEHTVDVFAFVETAFGSVLTAIGIILTLGVLRQRTELEEMLRSKKGEIVTDVVNQLDGGIQNKISLLDSRMGTQETILANQTNPNYTRLVNQVGDLVKRIEHLEQSTPEARVVTARDSLLNGWKKK